MKPSNESTSKSGKPLLKLVRCTKGTLFIVVFAIVPDIVRKREGILTLWLINLVVPAVL